MKNFLNTITMGDSLELLQQIPDSSIDAVITDPPYASGGNTMASKALPPSKKYEQSSNKVVHRPDFWVIQRITVHGCIGVFYGLMNVTEY